MATCSFCKGSGKNPRGGACGHCGGSGKEPDLRDK
jgi:hypothetical protein